MRSSSAGRRPTSPSLLRGLVNLRIQSVTGKDTSLKSIRKTAEFNNVNILKFLLSRETTLEGLFKLAGRRAKTSRAVRMNDDSSLNHEIRPFVSCKSISARLASLHRFKESSRLWCPIAGQCTTTEDRITARIPIRPRLALWGVDLAGDFAGSRSLRESLESIGPPLAAQLWFDRQFGITGQVGILGERARLLFKQGGQSPTIPMSKMLLVFQ